MHRVRHSYLLKLTKQLNKLWLAHHKPRSAQRHFPVAQPRERHDMSYMTVAVMWMQFRYESMGPWGLGSEASTQSMS